MLTSSKYSLNITIAYYSDMFVYYIINFNTYLITLHCHNWDKQASTVLIILADIITLFVYFPFQS